MNLRRLTIHYTAVLWKICKLKVNKLLKSYNLLYVHFRDVSTRNSIELPRTRSQTLSAERAANITLVAQQLERQLNLGNHEVPEGVNDFDKENWNDIFQVSHYTMDIFNYLKSREVC